MTTGIMHDQKLEKHIEKQMGCMAGFLQLFDRHHLLSGKRLCAPPKRLPPSPPLDSSSPETDKSVASPAMSEESGKPQQERVVTYPSPDHHRKQSPVSDASPARNSAPLHLSVMEFKEGTRSSWKFGKEAPRLSLDSRATFDAKGSLHPREIRTNAAILSSERCESNGDGAVDGDDQHRRSPSVIARLMGLEQLPQGSPGPIRNAELRRSASESRVSRDLFQCRFIDGNDSQPKQSNVVERDLSNARIENVRAVDRMEYLGNLKSEPHKASPYKLPPHRKSFFDSGDLFPEPKQSAVSVYGEIEKRLKMRGIDEPSKDLETLKQILEALQLKGLLHTKIPSEQINRRNFVYDRTFASYESPIAVMKPVRSPVSSRTGNRSPQSAPRSRAHTRRNSHLPGEYFPTASPRREQSNHDQNTRRANHSRSPVRSESNVKAPNSLNKQKQLTIDTQRKRNESMEQRRVSPVHSPKVTSKRYEYDHTSTTKSPRNRKPIADITTEDESSSISESSLSRDIQERSKMEEPKLGRSILERCDKLLHSIAEMNAANELQPSPVSVLDSFYKDESSPSPVMKRSIDFKEQFEEDEEIWSSVILPDQPYTEEHSSEDSDFVYISEILRASIYLPEDSDVFLLLEKRQCLKGSDTSKLFMLHRRLIFDTINEILDRHRQLPPWKSFSGSNSTNSLPSLQQIWTEFQSIQQRVTSENLFESVCGMLKKDLIGDSINGWGEFPVEMSDAVLDVERLIFKDLVGDVIQDLSTLARTNLISASRRKLVF